MCNDHRMCEECDEVHSSVDRLINNYNEEVKERCET